MDLKQVAQKLIDTDKKVQLIYAFNGSGKTRLSRKFKELVAPKNEDDEEELPQQKILYYSAFTEDLFYWNNDLELDEEPKLIIQPNRFTDWLLGLLKEQGQDGNIVENFQHYTDEKLTPYFDDDFTEITFSFERGDDESSRNIKISKGEESNFIWSVFYTLLEQAIATLNVPEVGDRVSQEFNDLQYIFIDDPVTSLDENHLIELAVNLADLIKSATNTLKFIITTHNPLFYNVLYNEINNKICYMLGRNEDSSFSFVEKSGDSNQSFSYHIHLRWTLERAIADNQIEKYHFTLLRNLYEKTASFLGYAKWGDLLNNVIGDKEAYLKRIITFSSHRSLSNEEVAEPNEQEKQTVKFLLDHLINNYGYLPKAEEQDG